MTPEKIIDVFKKAGMNVEPSPNALYTVRGQHAQLIEGARALLASHAIDGLSAEQDLWQTGTPPTKAGDYAEYIVAVRRKAAPDRVFVFSSNHANNYGADDLCNQDGDEFIANGWYTIGHDTSGEYDSLFMPMLEDGDEVLGWKPLPKWDSTLSAPVSMSEEPKATAWAVPVEIEHLNKGYRNSAVICNRNEGAYTLPVYLVAPAIAVASADDVLEKIDREKALKTSGHFDIGINNRMAYRDGWNDCVAAIKAKGAQRD